MGEEWKVYPKDIRLLISTHGRIRSALTGYDIKPKHFGKYYRLSYDVLDINVHHMVAQTFIPNPGSKIYVRHKNLDYHDNSVDNLEWTSRGTGGRKKGDGSTESASTRTAGSDSFTVGNYSIVYVPVPSKWAVFFEDELLGLFETRDEAVEHC